MQCITEHVMGCKYKQRNWLIALLYLHCIYINRTLTAINTYIYMEASIWRGFIELEGLLLNYWNSQLILIEWTSCSCLMPCHLFNDCNMKCIWIYNNIPTPMVLDTCFMSIFNTTSLILLNSMWRDRNMSIDVKKGIETTLEH